MSLLTNAWLPKPISSAYTAWCAPEKTKPEDYNESLKTVFKTTLAVIAFAAIKFGPHVGVVVPELATAAFLTVAFPRAGRYLVAGYFFCSSLKDGVNAGRNQDVTLAIKNIAFAAISYFVTTSKFDELHSSLYKKLPGYRAPEA